jgi:hypothetical protein
MKRTPFLVGLISMLSLGALGASGGQAFKLNLTPKLTTPSARQILLGTPGASRCYTRKGWPFNGKNRAARARLAAGFMAML